MAKTLADLFEDHHFPLTGEALKVLGGLPYAPTPQQVAEFSLLFQEVRTATDTEGVSRHIGYFFFFVFPYENKDGRLPAIMYTEYNSDGAFLSEEPRGVAMFQEKNMHTLAVSPEPICLR